MKVKLIYSCILYISIHEEITIPIQTTIDLYQIRKKEIVLENPTDLQSQRIAKRSHGIHFANTESCYPD